MERLTIIDGCGNDELARCMNCGLEKAGSNLENCGMCEEGWQRALRRLAAYEVTGLTPEEIKKHEAAYNECLTRTYGPFKQKISQWLQAEQAGRLVVLPCGTDVELVRDGYVFKADHWTHTLTAFRDEPKNKSGKQIALFSTKEAEAAMAQEGGTHEADSV